MQTAELAALPLSERLQAMEILWGTLCQEPEQVQPVPEWHQQVLSQRLAALETGGETVTPWEEAKDRIRQRTRPVISSQ
ncbi:MAG: addiction module protein [Rhodoferax sp.]|nr:addiction module protein [Rhodoferax sp.]